MPPSFPSEAEEQQLHVGGSVQPSLGSGTSCTHLTSRGPQHSEEHPSEHFLPFIKAVKARASENPKDRDEVIVMEIQSERRVQTRLETLLHGASPVWQPQSRRPWMWKMGLPALGRVCLRLPSV